MKALTIVVWIVLIFSAGHVLAADIPLPPVNLGDTSFEDGIAFPGWLVEETFDYYHAGQLNDHQGDKIPGFQQVHLCERHYSCRLYFQITTAWRFLRSRSPTPPGGCGSEYQLWP